MESKLVYELDHDEQIQPLHDSSYESKLTHTHSNEFGLNHSKTKQNKIIKIR